jgi:dihydroorotate dehydrogenase (NAD+) catalytic subunit
MDEMPLDFSRPKYDLEISPPVMNAAGTLGYAPQSSDLVKFDQLGAFITNPISLHPRTPARARTSRTFPGGFLLHSGYPNPGLRAVTRQYATRWARSALPVIIHLLVHQVDDVQPMVAQLEGREGLTGIELGIPPDCETSQAVKMVQAGIGELPLIVRVPMKRAGIFAGALVDAPLAAISLAPPRGAVLDQQGQPVSGRLFGPGVYPFALGAVQEAIDFGVPVIASGGVYHQQQIDAFLELGAFGVQLDAALWSLEDINGWE